jgi:hypothetical protein
LQGQDELGLLLGGSGRLSLPLFHDDLAGTALLGLGRPLLRHQFLFQSVGFSLAATGGYGSGGGVAAVGSTMATPLRGLRLWERVGKFWAPWREEESCCATNG